MFQLNNLRPAKGARRKKKRVGRGPGSGHGKTSTRGMNGHSSRAGGGAAPWFEGGQMPLYRRIPKRGFHSPNRVAYQVVNLADFARFEPGATVDLEYLHIKGIVSGHDARVKVLGFGEIEGAFSVRVHAISDTARKKLEAAGGQVEIVAWNRVIAEGGK